MHQSQGTWPEGTALLPTFLEFKLDYLRRWLVCHQGQRFSTCSIPPLVQHFHKEGTVARRNCFERKDDCDIEATIRDKITAQSFPLPLTKMQLLLLVHVLLLNGGGIIRRPTRSNHFTYFWVGLMVACRYPQTNTAIYLVYAQGEKRSKAD